METKNPLQVRDDILARITNFTKRDTGSMVVLTTLYRVLSLHFPMEGPDHVFCDHCTQLRIDEDVPYPCPTVMEIADSFLVLG